VSVDFTRTTKGAALVSCVSSATASARYKWETQPDTGETWVEQSDTSEIWTPQSDTAETWTEAA
jgi:hypothetical protein